MKHKTLGIATNLLNAGTAPDTVKKLLNINDKILLKAKEAVNKKVGKVETEQPS
ncbi:hypothetical protein VB796_06710 [Arcicella sp. LKC2W]|uniref:hypothetical protein n=1 Tax=Arcicella sp. LKC2W TaxID=2984198 RepID=UPI002B1F8B3E|nr:hypothetical protein [Arcicella sp. LKC2W]MEA5458719.1 hypothetical protein [Arcicella sp. LKC2W]